MKIEKMTDQQALDKFVEFLSTRISITTGFAETDQDGNFTHQFMRIKCGELELISEPELLDIPLRLATATELGATVN